MTDPGRDNYRGDESVIEVSALCLKESLAELFRRWEAAVDHSAENPEHVHELRVASRRTAAALELFADWLPRRKTEQLLRKLDAIRKSAGPARDCDVFAERISQTPQNEGGKLFAEHLRNQRATAQQSLASFYQECERGDAIERHAVELVGALRPHRRRSKNGNDQFSDWAPRELKRTVRKFFSDADPNTKQPEQLHAFRIRSKQFRYCLEFLGPALNVDRFHKAYSALKKLSQRLGDINDHATAIDTLSRWIDAEFDAKSMHTLRQWRKEERRALRCAIAEFAAWWTPSRQRQLRRKLKRAAKPNAEVAVTS